MCHDATSALPFLTQAQTLIDNIYLKFKKYRIPELDRSLKLPADLSLLVCAIFYPHFRFGSFEFMSDLLCYVKTFRVRLNLFDLIWFRVDFELRLTC